MTKRSSTPADAVLVAIDMSKHRQEVLIERPGFSAKEVRTLRRVITALSKRRRG